MYYGPESAHTTGNQPALDVSNQSQNIAVDSTGHEDASSISREPPVDVTSQAQNIATENAVPSAVGIPVPSTSQSADSTAFQPDRESVLQIAHRLVTFHKI